MVFAFPSASFTIGTEASCTVRLPDGEPGGLEARIDVLPGGEVRVKAVAGAVSVDGVATSSLQLIQPGQVVRLGAFGLLLRRAIPEASGRRPPEDRREETVQTSMLTPGTLVAGRYEVVAKLASGAMGDVYRVEHAALRKPFALKVLKVELSGDPEFVARFQREAIATTRVGQQNIVEVVDFGQLPAGPFYFVMEYLDGETLAAISHHSGAMPVHRVLKLGLQVARALAASHEQGVVHRDVKPDNIMVLERPGDPDFVKVLDFGVAKVPSDRGGVNQTAAGVIIGTPQYMAPEQCVGQPADARTDIYALGLILHELCRGRPVFDSTDTVGLMLEHMRTLAPRLGAGPLGDVPPDFDALLAMMLEKRADDRPRTMRQVIEMMSDIEFQLDRPRPPGVRDDVPTSQLMLRPGVAPRRVTDELPSRETATGSGSGPSPMTREPAVAGLPPTVREPPVRAALAAAGSPPPVSEAASGSTAPATSEGEVSAEFAVRRSKTPLLVVGGMGALLVVGALSMAFGGAADGARTGGTTPDEGLADAPPPPSLEAKPLEAVVTPAEDMPASRTWHITSRPLGALVTIDGVAVGKTPVDWTGAAGKPHELTATLEGHVPLTRPLVPSDAGSLELVFKKVSGRLNADLKDPFAAPAQEDELRNPFGDPP